MTSYRFDPAAGTRLAGELTPHAALAELERLHLHHAGLRLDHTGDRLALHGEAADTAARERLILALGNLQGIAVVEDLMAAAKPPGLLDSLSSFAHLPAGSADLAAARLAMDALPPEPGSSYGPAGSLFHPVRPDETLAELARRHYGDATEAPRLIAANTPPLPPGEPPVGWVLRIPPR